MVNRKRERVRKLIGKPDFGLPVCPPRPRGNRPCDLTDLLLDAAGQPHLADLPLPNAQAPPLSHSIAGQAGQVGPLPCPFQAAFKYAAQGFAPS